MVIYELDLLVPCKVYPLGKSGYLLSVQCNRIGPHAELQLLLLPLRRLPRGGRRRQRRRRRPLPHRPAQAAGQGGTRRRRFRQLILRTLLFRDSQISVKIKMYFTVSGLSLKDCAVTLIEFDTRDACAVQKRSGGQL